MFKHYALVILLLPLFMALFSSLNSNYHFYIFGALGCLDCLKFKDEIVKYFGAGCVTFYDITENQTYLKAYDMICNILDIPERPIPLTGVFVKGELRIVLSGYVSIKTLKDLLNKSKTKGVLLFHKGVVKVLRDEKIINKIEKLFLNPSYAIKGHRFKIEHILPLVLLCAFTDSVNPCTFAVFTALLLIILSISNKKHVLFSGFAFIAAVYIAYFLLGMGLMRIFYEFFFVKYIIAALGLFLGGYSLIKGAKGEVATPTPNFIKVKLNRLITKTTSIPLSFMAGIIVSFSLLPCSAGPYLVALYYLSNIEYSLATILLILYNIIFVLPLIIITLLVAFVSKMITKVKKKRERIVKLMGWIENLILIMLSIYIIVT